MLLGDRVIHSQDWIIILLGICMVLIALAKLFSKVSISDMLTTYGSDRFVTVTRTKDDGFLLLKLASLVVYAVCIALLMYGVATQFKTAPANLNTYLLCLLGAAFFLLVKHYIGKLVASLLKFEELLELIDFHRNVYRCMFSYMLFIVSVILFIALKGAAVYVTYVVALAGFIVLVYNLTLIYTYKKLFINHLFYFILYLCTLEIAPYLLLYKYFR